MGNKLIVTASLPALSERMTSEVVASELEVTIDGVSQGIEEIDKNLATKVVELGSVGGTILFRHTDIDDAGNRTDNLSGPYVVTDTVKPEARGPISIEVTEGDPE